MSAPGMTILISMMSTYISDDATRLRGLSDWIYDLESDGPEELTRDQFCEILGDQLSYIAAASLVVADSILAGAMPTPT